MVRRSIFDKIFREMQNIRFRLDDLENSMASWNPQPMEITESKLISLPDHLRRTYMIVASKGECSAIQVSNLSGRCRPIESNYLNQLARMGWLNKRRVSKTTHFRAVPEKVLQKTQTAQPTAKTKHAKPRANKVSTRTAEKTGKKSSPVTMLFCLDEDKTEPAE
ncbi:MAG: hypothetical protein NWF00_09700 [Candidatus Bathyarchaeota archaeon]|nr:hypothetical protein [Candidatus Bathyarchaeota archaeon]